MTPAEFATELGVDRAKVEAWASAGLPWSSKSPRRKRFDWDKCEIDPEEAAAWLLANGHARQERIVTTRQEVCNALGIKDRTLGYWKSAGMPMRVDGRYDIDAIEEWRLQRFGNADAPEAQSDGANRATHETEIARVKAERMRIELDEKLGRLIDIDTYDRLTLRHIHEIKSHHEQFAEFVVSLLPAKASPRFVKQFRRRVERKIQAMQQALAEACLNAGREESGE